MHKLVNGKKVKLTDEEIAARKKEEDLWRKEYEASKYQGQRFLEYPPLQDQLDMIYHEGLDAWKEMIRKIKEKYPKTTK